MNGPRSCALAVAALLAVSGCGPAEVHPEPGGDAGAAPSLTWSPEVADCGYTTPGIASRQTITFSNPGADAVVVSDLAVTPATDVRLLDDSGAGVTKLTVPAGGSANLVVEFTPMQVGGLQATLRFHTNLEAQPTGSIVLRCFGGGPDIDVKPWPTLNFGKVAYLPDAQTGVTRRVTVMNVGTLPRDGDLSGDLHLAGIEVVPPGDFTATLPESYDPTVGLSATVGGNSALLTVSVAPETTVGVHEAELRIHSNDPDEPVVTVALRAEVVQLPDCQYTVDPEVIHVGTISPPNFRDVAFSVSNGGDSDCILSGVHVAEGSTLGLTVPDTTGSSDSRTIAPGESFSIVVRVGSTTGASPTMPLTGRVVFYMSSSTRPEGFVEFTTAP